MWIPWGPHSEHIGIPYRFDKIAHMNSADTLKRIHKDSIEIAWRLVEIPYRLNAKRRIEHVTEIQAEVSQRLLRGSNWISGKLHRNYIGDVTGIPLTPQGLTQDGYRWVCIDHPVITSLWSNKSNDCWAPCSDDACSKNKQSETFNTWHDVDVYIMFCLWEDAVYIRHTLHSVTLSF